MWLKKHKRKMITIGLIAAVLAVSFWWGGRGTAPVGITQPDSAFQNTETLNTQGEVAPPSAESSAALPKEDGAADTVQEKEAPSPSPAGDTGRPEGEGALEEAAGSPSTPDAEKPEPAAIQSMETARPAEQPAAQEPAASVNTGDSVENKEMTCTLSVRCDGVFAYLDLLAPEKRGVIPEDGVIFPSQTVTFYEGENVFNLLVREMKKNKIHLEFVNTPLYDSAYIEGIGNLYEYDCGELSGWTYQVNGWQPNYGCSLYELQEGDVVEWIYTCDLGRDLQKGRPLQGN
jgi:hypothetical protein